MIVRAVASTLNGLSSRPPPGSSPKQKKSVKCNNAAKIPLLATIMKHANTQLKSAELASVLGVSPVQVRQVNKDKKSKKTSILDVKQVNKRKVALFLSETSVFSGASRATRKLLIPKTELLQRFYARYPKLLRGKAAENPGLLEAHRHKKHFT